MRVIRLEKIDVVHANLYAGETFGRLAAVLTGTPVVTHKRGMPFKSRKPQNILVDLLLNLCSARIIVVNHAIRRQLQRLHHLPASRFSVIYPGIDPALWSRPMHVRWWRSGLRWAWMARRSSRPLAGCVDQGAAVPARSRAADPAGCPEARFLFVGHGVEEAALHQQAVALGVDGATYFLGSRADVRELLAVSDVFVMPSLSEASPLP
jgi:glycosyltransferase involved in cell wall biosynthesis